MIACGITLIGATTYFFATRYVRKSRQNRQQVSTEDSDCEIDFLDDEEDYRSAAKRHHLRKSASSYRPPPLITFAELFEQALLL